jgi:hypothetical protein
MTTLSLEQISLRKAERGFLVGGTGTGKSTLADLLGAEFVRRYYRQGGRRLILDSKPRYRAEKTFQGLSAKNRYKKWDHGQSIPGSVVIDDPRDLKGAWDVTGCRTVIVQGESSADVPRLTYAAHLFLGDSKAGRPQLLQVDESMDFFHGNGLPKGGNDALIRAARAGRERGTAALYCSQRTRGIPPNLMEELERLYCFRLDYKADAKRLQEMGAPEFPLPSEPYVFMYWYKGSYNKTFGPYRLELAR